MGKIALNQTNHGRIMRLVRLLQEPPPIRAEINPMIFGHLFGRLGMA